MPIDAKSAFNIIGDGSDETAKLQAAFAAGAAASGDKLYFGPGVFGCADTLPVCAFEGAGMDRTIFKNLTPATKLFAFSPSGSFIQASSFTVDQNGCSAPAIEMRKQYQGLRDVKVRNQGGGREGGFAIDCKNATLANLDNVSMDNCDNGLKLDTCFYVKGSNVSIERQRGRALHAVNCAATYFDGLYLDHGNPGSLGSVVPEIALVDSCRSFLINGMGAEMDTAGALDINVPMPGEAGTRAYLVFKNSRNVNIKSGRVNHYAAEVSSLMFYFENCGASVDGFEWHESVSSMVLFGLAASNKRFSARGVDTYVSTSGSRYGVGAWFGKTGRVSMEDWTDWSNPIQSYLHADDIYARGVSSQVVVTAGSGTGTMRTIQNCPSVIG